MPSNTEILTEALRILAAHGVEVEQVPGWQDRTGSRSRVLVPEAVVVHHTGDPSTPLSLIRDGRSNLPGPLANFLVGQSGRVYLVAAGYSNNAGYGGQMNFANARAGKLTGEVAPPGSDGSWSANGHAWSIEGDGVGDWPAVVRENVARVAAALHLAHGWTSPRVIAHKELTRRKPGDPGDDMGGVRADVLALVREWSDPKEEPVPTTSLDFTAGQYNVQAKRWGGGKYLLDAKFVRHQLQPAVLFTQESDETARTAIVERTGMKVWAFLYLGLYWRPAVFAHGARMVLPLGTAYHGAVATTLTAAGMPGFVACSVHIRPRAAFASKAAADKGRRADIATVVAWLAEYPRVVVGGDWNTPEVFEAMAAAGYTGATPKEATTDGGKSLDAIFVRGLSVRSGVIVPTDASDHHGLRAELTITAPTTA